MIVFIDNYDSFVYNLVQYLGTLGADLRVFRNDEVKVKDILDLEPEGIVISPGPGAPSQAGICIELIQAALKTTVILGVCLGHQSIGEALGGRVVKAKKLLHGKTSMIEHDGKGIFTGLPSPLEACRYHSLAVCESELPPELVISARSEDGEIMGLRHRELPVEGVQFHPEAILTNHGMKMMENFLEMTSKRK